MVNSHPAWWSRLPNWIDCAFGKRQFGRKVTQVPAVGDGRRRISGRKQDGNAAAPPIRERSIVAELLHQFGALPIMLFLSRRCLTEEPHMLGTGEDLVDDLVDRSGLFGLAGCRRLLGKFTRFGISCE